MADNSVAVLKAQGLKTSPNPLTLPEGSLVETNNVITRRDGVMESRRGFKLYGSSAFSLVDSDRSKAILEYRNRLLNHYGTTLQYDDGSGSFTAFNVLTLTGTTTNTSTTITGISSTSSLIIGASVIGAGILDGTVVDSIDSATQITISQAANASATVSLTFRDPISEPETGTKIKSVSANGNFYFTSDTGIKKISASSSADFSQNLKTVSKAGLVRALDITANLDLQLGNQAGFLPEDSAVAYRMVWGKIDANSNKLLGTPSSRSEIYNPMTTTLNMDLDNLALLLDNLYQSGSLITDGNYVTTISPSSTKNAGQILTDLKTLCTKLDEDLLLADDGASPAPLNINTVAYDTAVRTLTIAFSGSPTLTNYFSVTSFIYLKNFAYTGGSGGNINRGVSIAALDDTTDTITINLDLGGDALTFSPTTNYQIFSNEYRTIADESLPAALIDPIGASQLYQLRAGINDILNQLSQEPIGIISTTLQTNVVSAVSSTTSADVKLEFSIPSEITSEYFYQIYRSDLVGTDALTPTVLGSDARTPNDEMKLIYESTPSSSELSARIITFTDDVPDSFRVNNVTLYTNATTGDGILQANDTPPWATDITAFKNTLFYANTKTNQIYTGLSLLGVSSIVGGDKLTISYGPGATNTKSLSFTDGAVQIQTISIGAGVISGDVSGKYFLLNGGNNANQYFVWFGANTDSAPANSETADKIGIKINLDAFVFSRANLAAKISDTLNTYINDFQCTYSTTDFTITTTVEGYTFHSNKSTPRTAVNSSSGATTNLTFNAPSVNGAGEYASTQEVLLSNNGTAAQNIDLTARSIVRVLNKQSNFNVYGYYSISASSAFGQITFQTKLIDDEEFVLLASSATLGDSFNPSLSPTSPVTANSLANPTVITSASHGLINGDYVIISGSNSTPSIDGLYPITYLTANTFSIPVNVTNAGTSGNFKKASTAEYSTNDRKINRVFYSKRQQPEAVPLVNFLDVGASDKAILRIIGIRDSVFVLKEDGVYRISGEISPFTLQLFDSSYILLAPESAVTLNNNICAWTSQGIATINESGVDIVSRDIDNEILRLQNQNNFKFNTFGLGYNSDNSYSVWTVTNTSDTYPTQCFRYNTLNATWSRFDISHVCGHILSFDDRIYLGASDTNYLEQERKSFTRTDYAERQYDISLGSSAVNGAILQLGNIANFAIGDVVYQEVYITPYLFNMLLKKLDIDPGVSDSDYYSLLAASAGSNMRQKLIELASKLDADPGITFTDFSSRIGSKTGSITSNTIANPTVVTASSHGLIDSRVVTISGVSGSSPTINSTYVSTLINANSFSVPVNVSISAGTGGTFSTQDSDVRDIKVCYNDIITRLNSDSGAFYTNYDTITDLTSLESSVNSIDVITKRVTLREALDFVAGTITLFKAIDCSFVYCPQTMGDVLSYKQFRQATLLVEHKNFTKAKMSFSTDLFPVFVETNVTGQGNGIFGMNTFGNGYFGGLGSTTPYRTTVPIQAQRCRTINIKFSHKTAREKWSVLGYSLTGRSFSEKAYRA